MSDFTYNKTRLFYRAHICNKHIWLVILHFCMPVSQFKVCFFDISRRKFFVSDFAMELIVAMHEIDCSC
jgi:hypothetical protein